MAGAVPFGMNLPLYNVSSIHLILLGVKLLVYLWSYLVDRDLDINISISDTGSDQCVQFRFHNRSPCSHIKSSATIHIFRF